MGSITVPHPLPSPTEDCEKLRKAVQGLGTDEKAIIKILGHRNSNQRKQIAQKYEELYNENLIKRLFDELSGDFRNAVILWTTDPPQRDATLCNKALRKKKANMVMIIEIACASLPDHLIAVRQAYLALYRHSLEEDVGTYVRRPLRKLLVSLVSSYRYAGEEVDETLAISEAKILQDAFADKYSEEQEEVIRIVSTRSKSQLRATFHHYKQSFGRHIDEDLGSCIDAKLAPLLRRAICCIGTPEKHVAKDLKSGIKAELVPLLRQAICCIDTPEKYFAKVVTSSVVGLGTDEDALTRAIVTRAEIDMERIKEEYRNLNEHTIEYAVVDDTSGDYRDFLLTLLGCGKL